MSPGAVIDSRRPAGDNRVMDAAIDRLRRLYEGGAAHSDYIGEAISQLDHALQAAQLAASACASDEEVLAALLHDVGHLCAPLPAVRMGTHGISTHEEVGADFLATLGFASGVTERVRGHVAAKRYLVAERPGYAEALSDASRMTLMHQGGPFDAQARRAFEAAPLFAALLRLRAWDEAAKVPGLVVPDFDHYVPRLESHLSAGLEVRT